MNIAIVSSSVDNLAWTSNSGYINSFIELNHTITLFPFNDKVNKINDLLDTKNEYDMVIIFGHGQLYDKRLSYKNFKCPIFAEMGDDPQQFNNNIRCAELYDILLTPDLRCVAKYKSAGWNNVYWWTHCYDQYKFSPNIETNKYTYDVVTGMYEYGRRVDLLKKLNFQKDFSFKNKIIEDVSEYANHLKSGKIVFNCSNNDEITRRLFEAMACGQFVLTDKIHETTGIYQLFTPGIHFDTYQNYEELYNKIKYYLEYEEERLDIADEGLEVVKDHSAMNRVDQLLTIYSKL